MNKEVANYLHQVLRKYSLDIPKEKDELFQAFAAEDAQQKDFDELNNIQKRMTERWTRKSLIDDIKSKALQIPNARVGKRYDFTFDVKALGLNGVAAFDLKAIGITGLEWDSVNKTLSGTPKEPGEHRLTLRFHVEGSDPDETMEERGIALVVNADPKSLWQNLPSNDTDSYWKPDSASATLTIADRKVVVASNRGRSHAHEGKFRDDDFKVASLNGTGWSIVAVADGAGGSKYSRKGSFIACNAAVQYFQEKLSPDEFVELESVIVANGASNTEETGKALSALVMAHMGKAAHHAHTSIAAEAEKQLAAVKDYSTTLIFALIKKFDFGYFISSFWVGDGGIAIYDREGGEVALLGIPDAGEFAGQTRFITMPDIFTSPNFYKRIFVRTVPRFTALVLMTDGITDPKFGTDAALSRIEKWNEFWADLGGTNDDRARVSFDPANDAIEKELLYWMDFWSPGNHDDRTLALVY